MGVELALLLVGVAAIVAFAMRSDGNKAGGSRTARSDMRFGGVQTPFGVAPFRSDLDRRIHEMELAEANYKENPTETNHQKFLKARDAYSNPSKYMRSDTKVKAIGKTATKKGRSK